MVASGVRLTGPTVHFVDDHYDQGPIIAQWPVPVYPSDSPDDIAKRVLEAEHRFYPIVVDAVAGGLIRLTKDNRVEFAEGFALSEPSLP